MLLTVSNSDIPPTCCERSICGRPISARFRHGGFETNKWPISRLSAINAESRNHLQSVDVQAMLAQRTEQQSSDHAMFFGAALTSHECGESAIGTTDGREKPQTRGCRGVIVLATTTQAIIEAPMHPIFVTFPDTVQYPISRHHSAGASSNPLVNSRRK